MAIADHARALRNAARSLGPRDGAYYVAQRVRARRDAEPFPLRSPDAKHPVEARPGTSDVEVFKQVFVEREYAEVDDLDDVRLILDLGANVGYTAAFLLSRYPSAELIAVEPDPGNFEALARNVRPYGDRVRTVQAAVWSHPTELELSDDSFRDGLEWSRQVREAEAGSNGAGRVRAVDVGTLLRESGHERISLLKMDVEGAEAVVFAEGYEEWLDRVDNMAVELHDDSSFGDARPAFERAIAGRGFSVTERAELTVCKRR